MSSALRARVRSSPPWQSVSKEGGDEKAQTDGRIAIKGEDKAKYGAVIRVMAAAHEAGIAKVGIASEKL